MSRLHPLFAVACLAVPLPLPHLKLTRSAPAADATVSAAPRELTFWFTESPELAMTRVTLKSSTGAAVTVGKATRSPDGQSVVVPVTGAMAAGRYTVSWRAGSKDGHPVNGTFAFTVAK